MSLSLNSPVHPGLHLTSVLWLSHVPCLLQSLRPSVSGALIGPGWLLSLDWSGGSGLHWSTCTWLEVPGRGKFTWSKLGGSFQMMRFDLRHSIPSQRFIPSGLYCMILHYMCDCRPFEQKVIFAAKYRLIPYLIGNLNFMHLWELFTLSRGN